MPSWKNVRAEFPTLHQLVNGKPLVYLDNAATTQKPQPVIDALSRFYECDNANVHRGLHALSMRATEAYEGARARVAKFIHAAAPEEIIFTRGTTESINLVAASWGGANLQPVPEPSTWAMMLVGVSGFGLLGWRRKARAVGGEA